MQGVESGLVLSPPVPVYLQDWQGGGDGVKGKRPTWAASENSRHQRGRNTN